METPSDKATTYSTTRTTPRVILSEPPSSVLAQRAPAFFINVEEGTGSFPVYPQFIHKAFYILWAGAPIIFLLAKTRIRVFPH